MSQASTQTLVGERKYHNKKAAYILPNDSSEHSRLEAQAAALRSLAGDKVIHAPLSAPAVRRALDIGCGTGVVAHELSSTFPNARVYGIDLTPVPTIREKLPNTEYIEGNVLEIADPQDPDPRFSPASFDYVFSRLLIMGMTEWKKYVNTCVSLTAPGGWVEMHDLAMYMRQFPENTPPANREAILPSSPSLADIQREPLPEQYKWQKSFYKLMEAQGLDPLSGMHLPQLFADAGLEDLHIRRILFPFADHDDLTDAEKQYLPHTKSTLSTMVPDVLKKIQADSGIVSDAEIDEITREAREHLDNFDKRRDFAWLYVVWGRKPL